MYVGMVRPQQQFHPQFQAALGLTFLRSGGGCFQLQRHRQTPLLQARLCTESYFCFDFHFAVLTPNNRK